MFFLAMIANAKVFSLPVKPDRFAWLSRKTAAQSKRSNP